MYLNTESAFDGIWEKLPEEIITKRKNPRLVLHYVYNNNYYITFSTLIK